MHIISSAHDAYLSAQIHQQRLKNSVYLWRKRDQCMICYCLGVLQHALNHWVKVVGHVVGHSLLFPFWLKWRLVTQPQDLLSHLDSPALYEPISTIRRFEFCGPALLLWLRCGCVLSGFAWVCDNDSLPGNSSWRGQVWETHTARASASWHGGTTAVARAVAGVWSLLLNNKTDLLKYSLIELLTLVLTG